MKIRKLITVFLLAGFAAILRADSPVDTVSYDDLLAAMKLSRGYDFLATTNAARFHAEVLFRLADAARKREPDGAPFFIRQEDWFRAAMAAAGVAEEKAPLFMALARKYGQDFTVEYRRDRVMEKILRGPEPLQALNVTYTWRARPNTDADYSYADVLSTPQLEVTNKRVINYQLVQFPDFILFDQIKGLYGRPTTGALGLLFKLIGEGRVVEVRMTPAPDGGTVVRATARKAGLSIGSTVTAKPDGKSEKGVPNDPAFRALEKRISQPITIRYAARPDEK